jgi:integrase
MTARRVAQPGSRLGMEVAHWPATDRVAWEAAFAPASPFDLRPTGYRLAPSTRSAITTCYARWIVWVKETDSEALDLPAAERTTQERVLAHLHALADEVAPLTLVGYACRLQRALELIAPETDWEWMGPIILRIQKRARQQPSVRHPFVPSAELYGFGLALMREAEADYEMDALPRAETFRDGLAVALLAARPLRRANFIGLNLAEHVTRTSEGWNVSIPADQTKVRSGPDLEFALPAGLNEPMERYLADHRLTLAGADLGLNARQDALWLSRSGAPWPSDTFADIVTRRTSKRFGIRLTPHEFRHCAATSIAEWLPAEARIVRIILGHTNGATAEGHYIHASGRSAAERYQKVVLTGRRAVSTAPTVQSSRRAGPT